MLFRSGKGYVGSGYVYPSGYTNDFFEYDPVANSWVAVAPWPAPLRIEPRAFVINNVAYAGCGYYGISNVCYKDFWTFGALQVPNVQIASSDTEWCDKGAVDFFDMSTNSPTFWQWTFTGGSPSTSTDQNPTGVYYAAPGTYDVKLVACNNAGCDSFTFSTFITVLNTPPQPTVTQVGNVLWSSPALTYAWYDLLQPGVLLASTPYFVPPVPGSYYVLITDTNGCVAASGNYVYTALDDLNGQSQMGSWIENGTIHIIFKDESILEGTLELFNTEGRLVLNKRCNIKDHSVELSASGLSDGIYYLRFGTGVQTYHSKLMLKN